TFKTKVKEVYDNVSNSFVGNIIKKIISFNKDFRKRMKDMWQYLKDLCKRTIDNIYNKINDSFVGRMLRSVRDLKTKFIDLAKDMWQSVKDQFNNSVDGAKGLPKRIGDGIKNAKDKAINGMKTVGNSLI